MIIIIFYSYAQVELSKGNIVVVMGNLSVKVGSDSMLLGHVMRYKSLGNRNENSERFLDFL